MTISDLKKLIIALRKSQESTNAISKAISWYTDWQCDFRWDQHLKGFLYDLIESQFWEYSFDMIDTYIYKWKYEVLDWDKVEADSEWNKRVTWDEREKYLKETITDDDRFIQYFCESLYGNQTMWLYFDRAFNWTLNFPSWQVIIKTKQWDLDLRTLVTLDNWRTLRAFPTVETEPKSFVIVKWSEDESDVNWFLICNEL